MSRGEERSPAKRRGSEDPGERSTESIAVWIVPGFTCPRAHGRAIREILTSNGETVTVCSTCTEVYRRSGDDGLRAFRGRA
jgi:hypothetical protein